MSAVDADFVLKDRGSSQALDEFVVSVVFTRSGVAAFGLGDGTLCLAPPTGAWTTVQAHEGGILAMAAAGDTVVTGGDDGQFCRTDATGSTRQIATFGSKWVDQVAGWSDGKADSKAALMACSVGKMVHVFDGAGAKLKELSHPSTVAGITFDAKGKRVAAAHYGGATLWFVGAKVDSPRLLEWKGSHIGIAMHPAGEAVVTAMQENALHGWRLSDGQHMRMSGYPAKTESLSFSRNGKWLATSGAESIVLWPFFGGGPMGKAPTELAGGGGDVQCTRVAFHPQSELVAAGFSDGLVIVANVPSQRILPMAAPGRGPVSALAWSADGTRLAFGTEQGFAALVDLSKR